MAAWTVIQSDPERRTFHTPVHSYPEQLAVDQQQEDYVAPFCYVV
jgi:hypothetical protein